MKVKTIRLHEDTYHRLEKLLGPRESFDHLVGRLCAIRESLQVIPDTLGPNHPVTAKRDSFGRPVRTHIK